MIFFTAVLYIQLQVHIACTVCALYNLSFFYGSVLPVGKHTGKIGTLRKYATSLAESVVNRNRHKYIYLLRYRGFVLQEQHNCGS